jgi:DNA mismatch repair ATPase MutL
MSRIRILPEAVANRIAAGAVVERLASVDKDQLDNLGIALKESL